MTSASLTQCAALAAICAAFMVPACGSTDQTKSVGDDGGAGGEAADNKGGAPKAGVGGEPNGNAGEPNGNAGEPMGGAPTSAGGAAGASGAFPANAGAGGQAGAGSTVPLQIVYNTGVDDSGVSLPGGTIDPHWTLIESADPTFAGPDAIVTSEIAAGYWVAQSDTSKWIAPSANQAYPGADPCDATGIYVYRTTFTLTSEQLATFALGGQWGADNYGIDILINDVSIGTSNVGYAPLTAFAVTTGFVAGLNTLDFEINDVGCPTGLRVELAATTP